MILRQVKGALLHGMKCDPPATTVKSLSATGSSASTSTIPLSSTDPLNSSVSPVLTTIKSLSSTGSSDSNPTVGLHSTSSLGSTGSSVHTTLASLSSTGTTDSAKLTSVSLTASLGVSQPTTQDSTPPTSMLSTQPISLDPATPTNPSLKLTTKDSPPQPNANDSVTEQNTTTIQPSRSLTVSNHSPQNSPTTVISSVVDSNTPNSGTLATTTHNENGKATLNQRDPSSVTTNPAPYSKSTGSQSIQTLEAQTTSDPNTPGPRGLDNDPKTSSSTPRSITYPVFDLSSSSEGSIVFETCKTLGQKLIGNCSVTLEFQGNQLVARVIINANQKIPTENYKLLEQKEEVSEETIPDTLVAILASCGALVLILCCFAAYCTYHRRSYRKNQQHLTEEMQTVENGYHDNPTLEVMEVVPEMQEKKLALNGEFNDSWIVPIDNLLKDDIPDEEDTHL